MARETRINGSSGEELRVYAPSEGMLAYREEFYRSAQLVPSQPRRRPVREPEPEPAVRPQRGTRRRSSRIFEPLPVLKMIRQNRFFVKLAFVVSLVTVAAFCLMVTLRFANIMAVQYDINKLQDSINAANTSINSLKDVKPVFNTTEFANGVGLVSGMRSTAAEPVAAVEVPDLAETGN
ncbi:MAG: hypothetical protein IJM85_05120 [Clostridia bacterium]|nr:hypothetical protein [Clostridia bacterium]